MTGNTNAASKTKQYANTKQFTGEYWTDGRPIYSIVCTGPEVHINGWANFSWVNVETLKIDKIITCIAMGRDSVATYPELTAVWPTAITTSNTLAIYSQTFNAYINTVVLKYVETV